MVSFVVVALLELALTSDSWGSRSLTVVVLDGDDPVFCPLPGIVAGGEQLLSVVSGCYEATREPLGF